jgi:hypothetical protein
VQRSATGLSVRPSNWRSVGLAPGLSLLLIGAGALAALALLLLLFSNDLHY